MSAGLRWEREVADYLDERDFETRLRYTTAGHEIDVYAVKGGDSLAVECKNYSRNVPPDPIRRIKKVADDVGSTPGIAYTSDLTTGAQSLAEKYDVVQLPATIVRGETLTIDDIQQQANEHRVGLPNNPSVDALNRPISPFTVTADFPEQVASTATEHAFAADDQGRLTRRIGAIVDRQSVETCVPILRNDRGTVDLYFVTSSRHAALPERIEKESVDLY